MRARKLLLDIEEDGLGYKGRLDTSTRAAATSSSEIPIT